MKTGAKGGSLRILSEAEVERINSASLALLQDPGVRSESALIRDIFQRAGARVDTETEVIQIPPDMVAAALETAPNSFVLHGRNDPDMDLLLESGRVYYGMGGTSEPFYWDYDQWQPRNPTKADMVRNTRVGHALSHIDFVQTLCMSGDKPTNQIFYHDFDAIFRNTTKPTVVTILERPFTQRLLEMTAVACGGEDVLRQRPGAMGIVTPVSPLVFPIMTEGIVDAVQAGVPILYAPGPMMGATGPATVAGTVALTNAEVLFGVVLIQLIRPGAPIVLKPDSNAFDMRASQCTYSSPEQNLGKVAMVQIARKHDMPIYGLGGGVEAKVPDAEAAAQATMNLLLNGLAGMTLSQSLGTMASGQYGSPEMVVICDEIVHMVKRVLRGFEVTEKTLAVDAILEAGHGGSFLPLDHTVRHFRQELFFPVLFQRQSIEQWQERGGVMAHELAHERVLEILEGAGPVTLPEGADAALERALNKAVAEAAEEN